MPETADNLRFGVQGDGQRYIARDCRGYCQHAVWKDGRVVWFAHQIGGTMKPFDGPDEVYTELTAGGLELWK